MAEPLAKLQPQFGRKRILVDSKRRAGILIDRHSSVAEDGLVASFHFSFLHRCTALDLVSGGEQGYMDERMAQQVG